jgi:hypothetical protein
MQDDRIALSGEEASELFKHHPSSSRPESKLVDGESPKGQFFQLTRHATILTIMPFVWGAK